VDCHMSASAGHTWWPTRPEDTIKYATSGVTNATTGKYVGYPNACAESCHAGKVNIFGYGYDANSIAGTTVDWTSAFETKLATKLEYYFGPGGTWFDTTPAP